MNPRPDRRTRALPAALASLVAALLVAACAVPGPTPTPTPAVAPTPPAPTDVPTPAVAPTPPAPTDVPTPAVAPTPPAPTDVPTPAVAPPPFACDLAVDRPGSVPLALISDLAAVNEAGLGRITFTFLPNGNVAAIPHVKVRPATPPFTMDPSGLPLDVAGVAFLEIVLLGGTALDASYEPTLEGPFDITPGGSPIVELKRAGDFEAVSSWVVGLDASACFRILPFDGSSRLVIEISTS